MGKLGGGCDGCRTEWACACCKWRLHWLTVGKVRCTSGWLAEEAGVGDFDDLIVTDNAIVSRNVEEAFLPKRNTTTSWDPSYILILVLVIQIVCCSHKLINESRLLLRHSPWHVGILNMRARRCKGYTYTGICIVWRWSRTAFKTLGFVLTSKVSRSNSNSRTR